MRNILCYGDSNTWGYKPSNSERYPYDVRWTGILQQELGAEYRIIEEGMNARTTAYDDPWSYWRNGKDYLPACLVSQKPLDLLIISLGTNDLKFTGAFGAMKGVETLISTTQMVQAKKESSVVFPEGMKILVVSPIELGKGIDENIDSVFCGKYEESCKFSAYFERMCARNNVYFLDAAKFAKPSTVDNIHMEPESHKALGLAIAEKIREIFA